MSSCWITAGRVAGLGGRVRDDAGGGVLVLGRLAGKRGARAVRRLYPVFNADLVDGIPARYLVGRTDTPPLHERYDLMEAFVQASGADVRHGSDETRYDPRADRVHMPDRHLFRTEDGYHSTLARELVRRTGAPGRLARTGAADGTDDLRARAIEDLVAEIGTAIVAARLGLVVLPRDDDARLAEACLEILESDPHAFCRAAADAERAADRLTGVPRSVGAPDRGEGFPPAGEDDGTAAVPRRGGTAPGPRYDIGCDSNVVAGDRVWWIEPRWSDREGGARVDGRRIVRGTVEAVEDGRIRVRVETVIGDDTLRGGDTIERSADVFDGYGARRAAWADEAGRERLAASPQHAADAHEVPVRDAASGWRP